MASTIAGTALKIGVVLVVLVLLWICKVTCCKNRMRGPPPATVTQVPRPAVMEMQGVQVVPRNGTASITTAPIPGKNLPPAPAYTATYPVMETAPVPVQQQQQPYYPMMNPAPSPAPPVQQLSLAAPAPAVPVPEGYVPPPAQQQQQPPSSSSSSPPALTNRPVVVEEVMGTADGVPQYQLHQPQPPVVAPQAPPAPGEILFHPVEIHGKSTYVANFEGRL